MIFRVPIAPQQKQPSVPKINSPILEILDEARQSLIKKYGHHEYLIVEDNCKYDVFDVMWIENNELKKIKYQKKITGFK